MELSVAVDWVIPGHTWRVCVCFSPASAIGDVLVADGYACARRDSVNSRCVETRVAPVRIRWGCGTCDSGRFGLSAIQLGVNKSRQELAIMGLRIEDALFETLCFGWRVTSFASRFADQCGLSQHDGRYCRRFCRWRLICGLFAPRRQWLLSAQ